MTAGIPENSTSGSSAPKLIDNQLLGFAVAVGAFNREEYSVWMHYPELVHLSG
jgi:hypothetical protein